MNPLEPAPQTPSPPLLRGLRRLRTALLPYLADPALGPDELRERTVLAVVSLIGGPLLCLYAWQNHQNGQLLFGAASLAAGLLLLYSYGRARTHRPRTSPRLAFVAVVVVLCLAMYHPNERLTLNWVTVLPMPLVFLFGLREGLFWIGVLFLCFGGMLLRGLVTGDVPDAPPWPSWNQYLDFSVAYLIVTGCAGGYEWLRLEALEAARARRREAEEALAARRRSEARLRDFTETASDWLVELDRDLRVTDISGRFEATTGVPVEAVLGNRADRIVDGWQVVHSGGLEKHMLAGRDFRDVRLELRGPDGERLDVNLRGRAIRDEAGNFLGYRTTGTDVTAQEETQRQLRETSRALQQASKMEAVGQLTSGVAHDFNNLLTVIMGNLELVALQIEEAGLDDEDLEQARSATSRAADLTSKLLAFSRRQSLRPEALAMNELLASTAGLLRHALPESIHVSVDLPPDAWWCSADRSQLESALLNLALNARDAIEGRGTLDLTVRNETLDDEAADAWSVPPGEYVRIEVRDSGAGIDPALVDHIFEPFFSTKPTGQGTGLGLSMVYGFVRQSGGGIRVESRLGEGTTMALLLPRAAPPGATALPARPVTARRGSGQPVLVIEDEVGVRNLVVSMLRRLGFSPHAAESGEAGVETFRTLRPAFVISDVVLAGTLNGVEAVNAIREIDPGVPALFMSGYSEAVFRDQKHLPEGVGLLPKPFGLAELEARLADLKPRSRAQRLPAEAEP